MAHTTVTNEDILDAISSFVQMVGDHFDAVEKRLDLVEHDVAGLRQVSYHQEKNFGTTIALLERAYPKAGIG